MNVLDSEIAVLAFSITGNKLSIVINGSVSTIENNVFSENNDNLSYDSSSKTITIPQVFDSLIACFSNTLDVGSFIIRDKITLDLKIAFKVKDKDNNILDYVYNFNDNELTSAFDVDKDVVRNIYYFNAYNPANKKIISLVPNVAIMSFVGNSLLLDSQSFSGSKILGTQSFSFPFLDYFIQEGDSSIYIYGSYYCIVDTRFFKYESKTISFIFDDENMLSFSKFLSFSLSFFEYRYGIICPKDYDSQKFLKQYFIFNEPSIKAKFESLVGSGGGNAGGGSGGGGVPTPSVKKDMDFVFNKNDCVKNLNFSENTFIIMEQFLCFDGGYRSIYLLNNNLFFDEKDLAKSDETITVNNFSRDIKSQGMYKKGNIVFVEDFLRAFKILDFGVLFVSAGVYRTIYKLNNFLWVDEEKLESST